MLDRLLMMFLVLFAAGAAGAFFLYVPVLHLVIAIAVITGTVSAAGMALAAGKLRRWVEIEETPPQERGL